MHIKANLIEFAAWIFHEYNPLEVCQHKNYDQLFTEGVVQMCQVSLFLKIYFRRQFALSWSFINHLQHHWIFSVDLEHILSQKQKLQKTTVVVLGSRRGTNSIDTPAVRLIFKRKILCCFELKQFPCIRKHATCLKQK